MNFRILWICWMTTCGLASAQLGLSETDRELLLERLKAIQESSAEKVKGKHSVAISAFKAAVESDAAALALYLKCKEKVDFVDQAKKSQDFREWKRREKNRLDQAGFRRALRHQLLWLLTTIEAAGTPDALTKMNDRATGALNAIFRDGEILGGHHRMLKSSVLGTSFAKAYELDKLKVGEWPTAPLAIGKMYETLILPPYRNADSLTKLRETWLERIKHEGLSRQIWGREGSAGKDRKPGFENWRIKGRLDLVWNMETDLFKAGDEKGAALRMLDHLKANLNHSSAPQWISEFTNLISGDSTDDQPSSK